MPTDWLCQFPGSPRTDCNRVTDSHIAWTCHGVAWRLQGELTVRYVHARNHIWHGTHHLSWRRWVVAGLCCKVLRVQITLCVQAIRDNCTILLEAQSQMSKCLTSKCSFFPLDYYNTLKSDWFYCYYSIVGFRRIIFWLLLWLIYTT